VKGRGPSSEKEDALGKTEKIIERSETRAVDDHEAALGAKHS
jgi:hypothetical protein